MSDLPTFGTLWERVKSPTPKHPDDGYFRKIGDEGPDLIELPNFQPIDLNEVIEVYALPDYVSGRPAGYARIKFADGRQTTLAGERVITLWDEMRARVAKTNEREKTDE